jgi:quinolinate synthase
MANDTIQQKIADWKQKRNAVILAHNYQLDEVQDIADFTGDSLELSQRAVKTDAKVIVFCGVHFMAETAAILNPEKTVLLPDKDSGCPMADMITADQLREVKGKHPGALVVCYVNSSAEVKAESDYCCTSSNAVAVVNALPAEAEIIFVPDQHLGQYVIDQTGRRMILWPGFCPTHARILESDILRQKAEHPQAEVLVHPECNEPVKKMADQVLSTGGMCRYIKTSPGREFIIGTELGIMHRLNKENPDKKFFAAKDVALCPNMKRITLETVLWSLQDMKYEIKVEPEIRQRAVTALERMLDHVGLHRKS